MKSKIFEHRLNCCIKYQKHAHLLKILAKLGAYFELITNAIFPQIFLRQFNKGDTNHRQFRDAIGQTFLTLFLWVLTLYFFILILPILRNMLKDLYVFLFHWKNIFNSYWKDIQLFLLKKWRCVDEFQLWRVVLHIPQSPSSSICS